MQPQRYSRVNVADLKAQIVKKIGPERSNRYFFYLNRLLSQRLSKVVFDRLCFRILGKENVPVHNHFVCSILKNACHSKTRPPVYDARRVKFTIVAGKNSPTIDKSHDHSGLVVSNQTPSAPIWSNGVVFPMSPRKGSSAVCDTKLRDRPSPLRHNGKADSTSPQLLAIDGTVVKIVIENGSLVPYDHQRPLQHIQGLAEQPDNGRRRIMKSAAAPVSLSGRDERDAAVLQEGEEVERIRHLNTTASTILAPLGIPFCTASIGGAQKALLLASPRNIVSYFGSGGLPDTETLKKHMDQIAQLQGLGGVSNECSNILTFMLDTYLVGLIRSCMELVGVRSGYDLERKLPNGIGPSNHLHMQSRAVPEEAMQEQAPRNSISLLDFKVAMELNPQQLGEDWPLLMEKICMHPFEE